MNDGPSFKSDNKKTNINNSYKEKKIVENNDRVHPEEENMYCVYLIMTYIFCGTKPNGEWGEGGYP